MNAGMSLQSFSPINAHWTKSTGLTLIPRNIIHFKTFISMIISSLLEMPHSTPGPKAVIWPYPDLQFAENRPGHRADLIFPHRKSKESS
jgi:hypothetical protein